ncbi:MAG: prolipoprotein diacylglyceryl transferase family protein [Gemmatimonadota bacterium]
MPLAFLPSPARSVWHLGPVPLRAQALCVVAGILVALGITAWRYRAAGGGPGVIADVAAWAVPAGLIPAALTVLLGAAHPGVLGAIRTWDQLAGFPGAVAFGAAGAWVGSRRARVTPRRGMGDPPGRGGAARASISRAGRARLSRARLSRARLNRGGLSRARGNGARSRGRVGFAAITGAAAPALLSGHAIAMLGQWLAQRGYGKPTALPWAVEISPAHRAAGLENFATFQPMFAYQALWDVGAGVVVIWVARRLALSGTRALALAAALYAVSGFALFWLGIGHSPAVLGLRAASLGDTLLLAAATIYLARTRRRRGTSAQLTGKAPLERSRPVL